MVRDDRTWFHFVARATRLPAPLCQYEVASWLWPMLERTFPDTLAAVIMPNHLHALAASRDPARDRWLLATSLGALARSRRLELRFEPLPDPEEVTGTDKLVRVLRYVVLNPCRARLVNDPLAWPWSTHRDVVGAIARPWVSRSELARLFGRSPGQLSRWLHAYVSSDPNVDVAGTPPPLPAAATELPAVPLSQVLSAAASATRSRSGGVARRGATRALFLGLAWHAGWRDTVLLGRTAAMSRQAVRKAFLRWQSATPSEHAALAAGVLCLGDARLRVHDV